MTLYDKLAKIEYSKDCYFSGFRALNIADFENHTGDWHRHVFWNPEANIKSSQILGKNSPTASIDTTRYFGEDGLYIANSVLKKMGVPEFAETIYAANHARAIADLVLYAALRYKDPWLLIDSFGLDDFMELDSDKQKVYDLLEKALLKIDGQSKNIIEIWLKKVKEIE